MRPSLNNAETAHHLGAISDDGAGVASEAAEEGEEVQLKLSRKKLQGARDGLGYTQDMLANEAGTSPNTARRAEHEKEIRHSTARKLAAALGVKVADLVKERS